MSHIDEARQRLTQLERLKSTRLGIFVSYDEKKHGNFQDAVDVCTAHEFVVWTQKAKVNTQRFSFPTTILIKIKGEDRYYRGELRAVKPAEKVDRKKVLADAVHRPAVWQTDGQEQAPKFQQCTVHRWIKEDSTSLRNWQG